jgi:ectoine hydroxylase-related dioxygenase (phytanoyl-CoA dioxygenase family)
MGSAGSHRHARGKPGTGDAVAVEMPAGSVLIFSGRLWHGGGANTSTRPRLGVVIDYAQPWLRPCEAHTLSADPGQVRLSRSGCRNCSASTSQRPTSGSSTASIHATG